MLKKINWSYWQVYSFALVLITLPMPKYSLNAQAIILMLLVWLLSGDFSNKMKRLKINKIRFFSISVWFVLFIVGLFYTDNISLGLKNIQKSAPLLVIPLVVFSERISINHLNFLIKWFSISVISCAFFALTKASYFTYMGFGNYFYNQNLAALLNIHTTYYSLFCVIVILNYLYQILFKINNIVYWLGILFLLLFMYLLSSRMGVFSLGVGVFVLIYYRFKAKAFLALIPISFAILALLFSPNFQKREVGSSQFGTTAPKLDTRVLHWKAVISAVTDENLFFGSGSGTSKSHVYDAYKNYNFTEGVLHKYNAHNQFLEHFIYFGLVSIIIWCFSFFVWVKDFKNYHPFLLACCVAVICFMLTESILERQHGIISFTLFVSLMLRIQYQKIDHN